MNDFTKDTSEILAQVKKLLAQHRCSGGCEYPKIAVSWNTYHSLIFSVESMFVHEEDDGWHSVGVKLYGCRLVPRDELKDGVILLIDEGVETDGVCGYSDTGDV